MAKSIVTIATAFAIILPAFPAQARKTERAHRIGFLHLGDIAARNSTRVLSFIQGLRDLGYVEGRNMRIEWRFAEGMRGRLPALAAELVAHKVDVIVTHSIPGVRAGKRATSTIPIVMGPVDNVVNFRKAAQ